MFHLLGVLAVSAIALGGQAQKAASSPPPGGSGDRLYGFDVLEEGVFTGKCKLMSSNLGYCEVATMKEYCKTLGFKGAFYGAGTFAYASPPGAADNDEAQDENLAGFVHFDGEKRFRILCKY